MKLNYFIVPIFIFITGCAVPVSQSNLYWGKYSHTLYDLKKEPSEKTKNAHENELTQIVSKSKEMNLKVPPGVYAELGVFAKERGDEASANRYFNLERSEYSESTVLMRRIADERLTAQ